MRASLRRLAATSLRNHQQDGGVLQLVQPPWQRMALALGRPLSAAATPAHITEATGAAMEQQQQQQQQQQQAPLPPRPPPPSLAPTNPAWHSRELNDRVLSFAERVFAADLDAEDKAEGQAATPEATPAEEEAELASAEAMAQRKADLMRRRRAKQLAASRLGSYKPYNEWLEAHAEGVAAFRTFAQRRGLAPAVDALLAHMYSSGSEYLMRPARQAGDELAGEASGAADAASAPAQQQEGQQEGQREQQLAAAQHSQGRMAADDRSSSSSSDGVDASSAGEAASDQPQQPEVQPQQPARGQQAALQAPEQPLLRAELDLDDLERSLAGLRLPRGALAQLLRGRPALLRSPPAEDALAALSELFGGRAALADVALRSPSVLHCNPWVVRHRITALMLHARCPDAAAAARMVARYPALLAVPEELIADNARLLASLMPARPYATVVERFPGLLAARLERRLKALQRRAPDRLARVDLTLLVSQQPSLLLGDARAVLSTWQELEAVCERVPAWAAELEALTQPVGSAEQRAQEQRRRRLAEAEVAEQQAEHAAQQAAGRAEGAPEADSWLQDVYRSAAAADQPQPAAAGLPPIHEAPSWFHQDPEAAAVAKQAGAFGTLTRQWPEPDRLRVRRLARLLDARPWQRLRLEYLAAEEPEAAGRRDLLDAVMSPKEEFARRHPGFPAWLAERRAAQREAAAAAWDEAALRPGLPGAGPAAGGPLAAAMPI